VRLELGKVVLASDGKDAWKKTADGDVVDLPRAEADVLEATALAIDAVLRDGGEEALSELKFTRGDAIYGRRASKHEVRDRAGRRRKLYFDTDTGVSAGVEGKDAAGREVEARYTFAEGPKGAALARIERVDDESGDRIGEDLFTEQQSGVSDDAF